MHLSNFRIHQKLTLLVLLLSISIVAIAILAFNLSSHDAFESKKQQAIAATQVVSGHISSLYETKAQQQIDDSTYYARLRDLIYQANYSDNSYFYLVGLDKKIIFHPEFRELEGASIKALSQKTKRAQVETGITRAAIEKESLWLEETTLKNSKTVATLTYATLIPSINILLVTDHQTDDFADINWLRASGFIAATLVLLIITLFFALLISRNIVQPISLLSREMKKISRGEIDQPISSTLRTDELGSMARALRHFRDQQVENNRLRHMQEHVRFLENFDPITRLYNRQAMGEILEQEIIRTADSSTQTYLLLISIDLLRNLTIELGNEQRDQILITTGKRLRKAVHQDHRLGRMGDNSFGLLLMEVNEELLLDDLINELLAEIKKPIQLDSMQIQVGVRIGITSYPDDGDQQFELIGRAEIAASTARKKEQEWLYFNSIRGAQQEQKIALWQDLSTAMDQDQFHLVFQPLFNLETNMLVSAEVLLRWTHPTYGQISPATFVPLAEQSGLISRLDSWVLNAVAKQCAQWKNDKLLYPTVAINLSGISFLKPDFEQQLNRIFEQHNVSLREIELELTEGVLIDDLSRITDQLCRVRATGASISIDDFGTGYSSLSRIKTLPIDHIKIDRSFIEDITESPQDLKIVQAIILMAHGLQLKVIAEGVETEEQLSILRKEHCDIVQGFLLSKPLSVDNYAALLEEDLIIEGE